MVMAGAFAPRHGVSRLTGRPRSPGSRQSITIVIPFPPGPGLDLVARMVGDKLSAGRPAGGLREPHRRQRPDRGGVRRAPRPTAIR